MQVSRVRVLARFARHVAVAVALPLAFSLIPTSALAADDPVPQAKVRIDLPEAMSASQVLNILRQEWGVEMVVGQALDLDRKVIQPFSLTRTPDDILKYVCKSANINCVYDTDLRMWDVNQQTIKLPPGAGGDILDGLPTRTHLTADSNAGASVGAGYPMAGAGEETSPFAGTPIDPLDIASGPPAKMGFYIVPVRNMEATQMVAILQTGDITNVTNPLVALELSVRNASGYIPGSYFVRNGGFSTGGGAIPTTPDTAAGLSGTPWVSGPGDSAAGLISQIQSAATSQGLTQSSVSGPSGSSGANPFGLKPSNGANHSTRSGDAFAQFPGLPTQPGQTPGRPGAGGTAAAAQQNPYGDLLPKGTKLLPNPNDDTILAFTTPDGLQTLKELVAALDVAPVNILIRVTKLIVSESSTDAVGLDYNLGTPLFTVATNTGAAGTPGTLNVSYLGSNISATLYALASRNNSRVVATPRIMLPNGVPGTISDLTVTPYVLPAVSGGAFGGGPIQEGVSGATVTGISIPILARLNGDGTITVYTFISDSQQGAAIAVSGGTGPSPVSTVSFPVPGIRVENGDTIVLGGFSSQETDTSLKEVPVLGELPLIGSLFRTSINTHTRDEALYFITCNVVDVHGQTIPGGPDAVKHELSRMSESGLSEAANAGTNAPDLLPTPGGPGATTTPGAGPAAGAGANPLPAPGI